jgi:hypothetical protein
MMADRHIACVEQGAMDAVLGAVRLLNEAGDTRGALRELEHFVAALKDKGWCHSRWWSCRNLRRVIDSCGS